MLSYDESEGSLKDFIDDNESDAKTTSSDSGSDSEKSASSNSKKKKLPTRRKTRATAAVECRRLNFLMCNT